MFETEQTNQVDNEFLAGLEADDFSEDTEEETTAETDSEVEQTSEAEQEQEGAQEQQQEQQEEKPAEAEMFPKTIKFLGEDRQITMEEAVPLIQKGLNYDRVIDKYKAQVAQLQSDPRIAYVDTMAQKAGMDANAYITMQNNQSEYQALIDEYGDVASVPAAIMDKFNKYSQSAIEKAQADSKAAKDQAYLEEKAAEFTEFMEKHPEVSSELPKEVVAMVSDGESLEGAYARYRVPELEKQLAQVKKDYEIYKANSANKNSRIPDAKGGKKKVMDDFLEGLLG